ncbi:MAG: AzlD domain-containing protein [Pseudomonadota bacterium]
MIEPGVIWIVILGLGLTTYAIRFSFLGLLGGRPVPERLRRVLGFVPATVLPALIAPMVFTDGAGALAIDPPVAIAAGAAFLAAYLRQSTISGLLAGAAAFGVATAVV